MSDYHFLNMIKQQAAMLGSLRTDTRVGEVTSVDTKNYCVKALVQPDNAESGWLPVTTLWSGNNWGLFAIPSIGDQVKIDFFMGALDVGIVTGVIANNKKAPLDAPVGEFWLVHASGSSLKFTNDGNVTLVSDKDLDATVGGNLSADVTGSATVTAKGGIKQDGQGNGQVKGCVQGDSICAFTGQPHPMISATVKASK